MEHKDAAKSGPVGTFTNQYTLIHSTPSFLVCKKSFMSTLGITKARIDTALRKTGTSGTPTRDQRGRLPEARKMPDQQTERVHEFVHFLPTVANHYNRTKVPHRQYVDFHLSVNNLYTMYSTWIGYTRCIRMNRRWTVLITTRSLTLSSTSHSYLLKLTPVPSVIS